MQALTLGRIGGSDVAAICGVSQWRTAADVYNRIVHGIDPPASPALAAAARAGRLAEHGTAVELCHRLGRDPGTLHQPPSRDVPSRPWQRYSVDYIASALPGGTPYVIECKLREHNAKKRQGWGADGTTDIPADVYLQAQTYLEAIRHDRDWWRDTDVPEQPMHVAVRFGAFGFASYVIPYDEVLGAHIVETCERFWIDHVRAGVAPTTKGMVYNGKR